MPECHYRAPMRSVLVLLALCACKSTAPLRAEDAEVTLAESRRLVAAGDLPAARLRLQAYGRQQFPAALQPQFELLLGRLQMDLGEPWEAYLAIRDFADDHPHSDLREQVIDLEFEAGSTLAASDRGFLFFWSDQRGGRTCLEHLITRYPNSRHVPDALRILGEMAMASGHYGEAEERFRELLRRHPESEWAPLARFRFAMSIFASLRGPEYDLDKLESATRELQVFLQNPPENPTFVREATAALAQVLAWRAERHLIVASFYRTVDNEAGELLHLRAVVSPEFAHTEAAKEARRRLGSRGEALPVAPPERPAGGGSQ